LSSETPQNKSWPDVNLTAVHPVYIGRMETVLRADSVSPAVGERIEAQVPPDAVPMHGGTHPSSGDSAAMTCASSLGELTDFESVVRCYERTIFGFVLASLRDRDAAETLTQDCFFRAYRSRRDFRGDSSVKTWLMRIAVNLVRDHASSERLKFWRQTKRFDIDLVAAAERIADGRESPEAVVAASEKVGAVWRAARGLSQRQRTVLLLRFVQDMDILEIAAAMGMKEGTVKVHLFRALQAVRQRIEAVR
jgi:RNA polymerase sigma-70 factor (ECF subfamily)